MLSSAQLAVAREYGFASWARLKLEVDRRDILNSRDLSRLTRLLAEHPGMATVKMEHWCDHKCAGTLGYMAMLRFDHGRLGLPGELPGTGAIARALIEAGAPVDGYPEDAGAKIQFGGQPLRAQQEPGEPLVAFDHDQVGRAGFAEQDERRGQLPVPEVLGDLPVDRPGGWSCHGPSLQAPSAASLVPPEKSVQ
jgi:hypothetical protein